MNQGPKWLKKLNAPCDASLGLFCFPCAGAGASMFRNWPRRLPAGTEVWAAQLPGRDSRFLEAPVKQMASMVACITAELLLLPETPYVLCGHSMGALIAFETARLIRKRGKSLPVGLIVSGNRPPRMQVTALATYHLPDAELVAELRRMNGMQPEILDNQEFLELLLPVIRADLFVCQTCRYVAAEKLACPIVAFEGQDDDEAPAESMDGWAEESEAEFRRVTLPGGHFYLQTSEGRFLGSPSSEMRSLVAAVGQAPAGGS